MHKLLLYLILAAIFIVGFNLSRNFVTKNPLKIDTVSKTESARVIKEGCDEECKKEIQKQIALALASVSGTPKTSAAVLTTNTPQSPKPADSYIQISGSGVTQKTDWTDVPGTDFSFDVNADFGKGARLAWEGFLRIKDANGTAFARIYDATHAIGVNGSEISVTDKADYFKANSTNLNFWSGRNTYRVQIKSLNTVQVEYMGGKIRVSY